MVSNAPCSETWMFRVSEEEQGASQISGLTVDGVKERDRGLFRGTTGTPKTLILSQFSFVISAATLTAGRHRQVLVGKCGSKKKKQVILSVAVFMALGYCTILTPRERTETSCFMVFQSFTFSLLLLLWSTRQVRIYWWGQIMSTGCIFYTFTQN